MQIKNFVADLQHYRQQFVAYIDKMDSVHLRQTCHNRIGTIGRQFRHVHDILDLYMNAYVTGSVNFDQKERNRRMEEEKTLLLERFKQQQERIESFLLTTDYIDLKKGIQFPGLGEITFARLLEIAIQHEALHLGIIYTEITMCGIEGTAPY